jgi:hypothetical protein
MGMGISGYMLSGFVTYELALLQEFNGIWESLSFQL